MREETRRRFHDDLAQLQATLYREADLATTAVARSVEALVHRNNELAHAVIDGDDEVDECYLEIERHILEMIALQTPVATDLRLVSAILHTNLHLERVGDQAVNIAKIYLLTQDLPTDSTILSHLQEMSDIVCRMLRTAIDSFVRRDLELCLRLPEMDDPVDLLNRGMYLQVLRLAGHPAALEWGIQMNVVARQLERVGDNAVDIAEQVGFLLTGEFREFTDASHLIEP
ncbi:MAG: phosphate signaling complex protein PhoU [Actinomycetota bacterium]|nr:phosphate signaling complex protein PhoU [Actinomycetota bacterium]